MLVDSHCHLDYSDLSNDIDNIVERAKLNNIGTMVSICTNISNFSSVKEISQRFDNIYCSVGVHPHAASEEGQRSPNKIIEYCEYKKVIGIGETGLDYYYEFSTKKDQKSNFLVHIQAARETGLPLIIHSRDADEEMIDLLESEYMKEPFLGVMHCFSSSKELAVAALNIGFYISFSGIITFKKADDLRLIAKEVPINKILIETDAPYLAPVPNRGKGNEPSFLIHTAKKLAEIKEVSYEHLSEITTSNFFKLFKRAESNF